MRPRKPVDVIEEVVSVQQRSVPVLLKVSVELVRSGAGDEIHVCAGIASVFDAVAVLHHGGFGNLVLAEQKVAGAGIVEVQVGIVIVVPVNREQIRRSWQSVRAEVPISTARVHGDAGNRERDCGNVATRRREVFYLRGIEASRQIRVLRIHYGRLVANLNYLLRRLQFGDQIHRCHLSQQDGDAGFLRLQSRRLSGDGIRARTDQGEPVNARCVCSSGDGGAGIHTAQRDCGAGDYRARGVREGTGDITGG